jgi:hypothetical protein
MKVIEFVSAINETIPSVEQVIKKFQWDSSDISIQKANRLQSEYRIMINEMSENASELENLIHNTSMSEMQMQIGGIVFGREIDVVNEHFQWFATYNDFHRICLNVKDGSVVWSDGDSEDYDEVAISLSEFLAFVVIDDRYSKNQVWGLEFSKPEYGIKIREMIENGLSEWFVSTLMYDWPWK